MENSNTDEEWWRRFGRPNFWVPVVWVHAVTVKLVKVMLRLLKQVSFTNIIAYITEDSHD